jgi:hypothetical protein
MRGSRGLYTPEGCERRDHACGILELLTHLKLSDILCYESVIDGEAQDIKASRIILRSEGAQQDIR